ncbi:MAG: 6,7-dimethyl-8-ribityllumazine synthase [Verrucomicrobiae bacterium]|nr:6,7-dimethyl-8-ribityllumazine synthase [Verrucomicrobiae bacterium]
MLENEKLPAIFPLASGDRRQLGKLRFAVVAARFNPKLADALLASTLDSLDQSGARQVESFRTPGSYEVPTIVAHLAKTGRYQAIIALGVIMRGATLHAEHIGAAATINLQRLSIKTGVPIIHQILTPRNERDARARVRLRGIEAAHAAIDMALLMKKLPVKR